MSRESEFLAFKPHCEYLSSDGKCLAEAGFKECNLENCSLMPPESIYTTKDSSEDEVESSLEKLLKEKQENISRNREEFAKSLQGMITHD